MEVILRITSPTIRPVVEVVTLEAALAAKAYYADRNPLVTVEIIR